MPMNKPSQDPDFKVKNMNARLLAVQAVYQSLHNDQDLDDVCREYLEHRVQMEVEGEQLAQPDGALFRSILQGVKARRDDIQSLLEGHLKKDDIDVLLQSILFCGIFELMAHGDVDPAIIINDYLNVAHSFYEHGESTLINGVLDAVLKSIRV